jgi:hypothetical protein
MPDHPRPRYYVPWPIMRTVGAIPFRYSKRRRAFVLRVVGQRGGPVIREY